MFADLEPITHRNSDDEIELVKRIKDRDEDALSELYDLYSGLLFGMIISIVKKQEEAERLLQDIFVDIWSNAETFNEDSGNVFTWIVSLARKQTINFIRTASDNSVPITLAGNAFDPMGTTIFSDRSELIKKALHEIPEEQSEIIKIASYRGLTQSEIADHLNITIDAVKTRLGNGIVNLERIMREYISIDD